MRAIDAYLVHWHAPGWCRDSAASLLASTGVGIRVTVLNNGGELTLPRGVRLVELGMNRGFAGAVNFGLREFLAGQDEYVLLGSHDVLLAEDTVGLLISAMDEHPDIGLLAPVLEGAGSGANVGGEGDFQERTWVSGAFLLLRRSCAKSVGLFDERYGSYVEDVDYCLRARDRGWRVGVLTTSQGRQIGSVDPVRAALLMRANWIVLHCKRGEVRAAVRYATETCWLAGNHLRRGRFKSAALFGCAVALGTGRSVQLLWRRGTQSTYP